MQANALTDELTPKSRTLSSRARHHRRMQLPVRVRDVLLASFVVAAAFGPAEPGAGEPPDSSLFDDLEPEPGSGTPLPVEAPHVSFRAALAGAVEDFDADAYRLVRASALARPSDRQTARILACLARRARALSAHTHP